MHFSQPLLTIAIPTFNGARTICDMMDILLPQINDQVEVIVCDNASTDGTGDIIKAYMKKYSSITYIRNERNIGADGNFLKCMQLAKGRFTFLLSDDDILVENALEHILLFLHAHPDTALVYLSTCNFHYRYTGLSDCSFPIALADHDIYTQNKKEFMSYAKHFWGFLSSFIISTSEFNRIQAPEQFFGTFWLQSYIHILCSSKPGAFVGVIARVCVAAGVYMSQSNFDTAAIDGVYYRKLLDFAIEKGGYNQTQLDHWFIKRLCLLASHGIVKERASGHYIIDKRLLYHLTWKYPYAWFHLYPAFAIPPFACRAIMKAYQKAKGAPCQMVFNRAGDQKTEINPEAR